MGGKSFMIGHGYIWVTVKFTSSCVISENFQIVTGDEDILLVIV